MRRWQWKNCVGLGWLVIGALLACSAGCRRNGVAKRPESSRSGTSNAVDERHGDTTALASPSKSGSNDGSPTSDSPGSDESSRGETGGPASAAALADFPTLATLSLSAPQWSELSEDLSRPPRSEPGQPGPRQASEEALTVQRTEPQGATALEHRYLLQGEFYLELQYLFAPAADSRGEAILEVGFLSEGERATVGIRRSVAARTPTPLAIRRAKNLVSVYQDGQRLQTRQVQGGDGRLFVRLSGAGAARVSRVRLASAPVEAPDADDRSTAFSLLSQWDPSIDSLRHGKGRRDGAAFLAVSPNASSLFRSRRRANRNFLLTIRLRRESGPGGCYVVLPIAGRMAALVIDTARPQSPRSGMALVDGMAPKNPKYAAAAHHGELLPLGEWRTLDIRVRGRELRLEVDQRQTYRWDSDLARLSLTPFFQTPFDGEVLFGCSNSIFRISRCELRLLSDVPLAAAPPQ